MTPSRGVQGRRAPDAEVHFAGGERGSPRGGHMQIIKLSLAAMSATVALFALVGVASANDLSVSSQTMRVTWTRAEFIGGFGTVACAFTVEGSMHTRTTTKTAGALVGFVTRASVGPCPTGSATVLTVTLPWHVQYAGFTGTLPTIGSVIENIIGASWQIREPTFGITCLVRSTALSPNTATFTLASGSVTRVTLGGSIPCGSFTGSAGGASSTNSALTITLI